MTILGRFIHTNPASAVGTPTSSPPLSREATLEGDGEHAKKPGKKTGALSFGHFPKFGGAHEKNGASSHPPAVHPETSPDSMAPSQKVDPSRLSQFSLRLSELVNRSFVASNSPSTTPPPLTITSPFTGAQVSMPRLQSITYGNYHLPDRVKVIEMTRLFVYELQMAATMDPYLARAVARAIRKLVSQFVTRLESFLITAARDPGALEVPTTVKAAQRLPAAMEFNLALMSLEWIVEESLERCLEGYPPLALLNSPHILVPTTSEGEAAPRMPPYVHEILSPLREQMEASIMHVVQPILVQVKASLASCIMRAHPTPFQPQAPSSAGHDSPSLSSSKAGSWLRELEERLDAAHRLLFLRIVERCGQDGQAWFIGVAIHVIWKGLVAITSRSVFAPASVVESQFAHTFGRTSGATPTLSVLNSLLAGDGSSGKRVPTPSQLALALRSVGKHGGHRLRRQPGEAASGALTPQEGIQPGEFEGWKTHFTLPNDERDCYVLNPVLVAEQLHDLQVFERLINQFTSDLLNSAQAQKRRRSVSKQRRPMEEMHTGEAASSTPSESTSDDEDDLAFAALKEALEALQSTVVVLRTLLQEPDTLQHLSHRTRPGADDTSEMLSPAAVHAFNVIPELLLIHISFCRIPPGWTKRDENVDQQQTRADLLPTPPQIFGYTWEKYDAELTGFAAGEAASSLLADSYLPVLASVYEMLDARCPDADQDGLRSSTQTPCSPDPDADAYSEHSDSSGPDSDAMFAMTRSAPALDSLPPASPQSGTSGAGELGDNGRSRPRHRTAISNRFWRRPPAQSSSLVPFQLSNALPPRVSRANATMSPYGIGRYGRRHSPLTHSSSSLPRSATHTWAHMHRNALNMFDTILLRVGQTYRSTQP